MKQLIFLGFLILVLYSCEKELTGTDVKDHFFLENKGANMPVLVEGNTASGIFVIVLHGGPGGDAMIYNHAIKEFSDPLEEEYAVVYWDQRASGNASGKFKRELLEIDQFVEDLDRLLSLLEFRYGNDIQHFLMGHSWGGALGTAYLTTAAYQNRISGWINVAGVHNFLDYATMTRRCLLNLASTQLDSEEYGKKWEEILGFCNELDENNITDSERTRLNQYGHKSGAYLTDDGIIKENEISVLDALKYASFSNHNALTASANLIFTGLELFDKTDKNYTEALKLVNTPSIYIWGKYDCVVPLEMGEQAFAAHGSEDKELFILERSGHSPMVNETDVFVETVIRFVEKYK